MVFCGKCGQKAEEGTKFCPVCGTSLHVADNRPKGMAGKLWDTVDTTADFDGTDIERNKVMGMLAYFGLLVIIPILGARESKYARYHANQGLILLIALVGWGRLIMY